MQRGDCKWGADRGAERIGIRDEEGEAVASGGAWKGEHRGGKGE